MQCEGFLPPRLVAGAPPELEQRTAREGYQLTRAPTRADALETIEAVVGGSAAGVIADGAVSPVVFDAIWQALALGLPVLGMAMTDLGEEYLITGTVEVSFDMGLYNTSTDSLGDTSDVGNVTSEPGGASYARQGTLTSAGDFSGDWGVDNFSQESFDLSDSSTGSVDGWFFVKSFQAQDTGDGSATDHLIVFGNLSKSYDLGSVDTLNISAGTVGFKVS